MKFPWSKKPSLSNLKTTRLYCSHCGCPMEQGGRREGSVTFDPTSGLGSSKWRSIWCCSKIVGKFQVDFDENGKMWVYEYGYISEHDYYLLDSVYFKYEKSECETE